MQDKKLIGFLLQLVGQSGGDLDYPDSLSPQEIAELLKVLVMQVLLEFTIFLSFCNTQ